MGGSALKSPRRIFSQNGADPGLDIRVTVLENAEYKVIYYESISSTSGQITIPTGATILLDQFESGADAYASTIVNSQPSGSFPTTAGGINVDVTSFDASGNYVLNGTPSAYPVALIYLLKIKAKDYSNLTLSKIVDREDLGIKLKRVVAVASSATPTVNADVTDIARITSLATAVTNMSTNLSGTFSHGQFLCYEITDNGTARALAWGTSFAATTSYALPTTTVISTLGRYLFQYNSATSKLEIVGSI